jgi:PAS domain S-box-containing protein
MKNIFPFKKKSYKYPDEVTVTKGSSGENTDLMVSERLKESELLYRRLFETAQDGILILDFETGNIVEANPFIIKIIEYPLESVIGKKLWEIGLFNNKEHSEEAFIDLKKDNYIRFDNMPLRRKDGKKIDVEFISNVYLVSREKVIQCNIREITERKQAEKRQELTARILSILNTQSEWQQLIKDILIEIKNFIDIEAVGIRMKEGNDFPYYEAIGFPESFINSERYLCRRNEKGEIILDEEGKPYLECMCGNILTGRIDTSLPYFTDGGSFCSNDITLLLGETTDKEIQSLTRNRCNEEGYRSVALIPIYSGKEIIGLLQLNDRRPEKFSMELIDFFEKTGNTLGIAYTRISNENKIKEREQILEAQNADYIKLNNEYSVLNDELVKSLNQIRIINNELNASKVKAEESDNLKTAFLANMSHEIRTPMNAIMGFSDFLLDPGLTREKLEDFVRIIHASSLQLLSVINDIIDISKIEAGLIPVSKEIVDINAILDELTVTYTKIARHKNSGLSFSCNHPSDIIFINTDSNKIRQIFCNLLNNAIKFTNEGSVEFGYKTKEGFIEFYVKDTGIGIAAENQILIFSRFRQVENTDTRTYGGNGLGLSISKALVEKLGGTITVNSEIGTGSTFVFTIPDIKSDEQAADTQVITKPDRLNWKGKTILLVEDEENNHAFIGELLSITNATILHAWDGSEAVEQVKKHSGISLVLMDIKMPVMNGTQAMRLIKQISPELPVIAQTAYAMNHDRNKALEDGFDNYLTKPIDRKLFYEVLNSYLN